VTVEVAAGNGAAGASARSSEPSDQPLADQLQISAAQVGSGLPGVGAR
jgi:hypothetical protein